MRVTGSDFAVILMQKNKLGEFCRILNKRSIAVTKESHAITTPTHHISLKPSQYLSDIWLYAAFSLCALRWHIADPNASCRHY
jgi:hypothetical protein